MYIRGGFIFAESNVSGLPRVSDRLEPPDDLLDAFPAPLAHRVTALRGSAFVAPRTSSLRCVLRHVRRDVAIATRRDEVTRVAARFGAEGYAAPTGHVRVEHGKRIAPYGATAREVGPEIYDETVAIRHQRMRGVGKLCLRAVALPREARVGIRVRLMRLVGSLLTMEVDGRVARIIRRLLGVVARHLEAFLDHSHVEEPSEEQIIVELFAELPLAPHRVKRHQQHHLQPPFQQNRRTACTCVPRVERPQKAPRGPCPPAL
jgi:hypothetical protein